MITLAEDGKIAECFNDFFAYAVEEICINLDNRYMKFCPH